MSEFTCSKCLHTFNKTRDGSWDDKKAAEEFLTNHPECKNDPTEILCDDCHILFLEWFATLTEEQKKKMRQDFYKEIN